MSSQVKNSSLTSVDIRALKNTRCISMVTAYDFPSTVFADRAGVDMLLVGDSLGMVMLGQDDTLKVHMDMMVHHCQAVAMAKPKALIVCDMPFMSYEASVQEALHNGARLMAEGGARAVKLEGASHILPQVRALIAAGIPVMGHIGLTPQRMASLGGFKVQGRSVQAAKILVEEALALEDAGCFSLVLECVPKEVAAIITKKLHIPTIGIGAGNACDGQVLVYHDMLGLNPRQTPKFVKKYADLGEEVTKAMRAYVQDVQQGHFPQEEHSFHLHEEEIQEFKKLYGDI